MTRYASSDRSVERTRREQQVAAETQRSGMAGGGGGDETTLCRMVSYDGEAAGFTLQPQLVIKEEDAAPVITDAGDAVTECYCLNEMTAVHDSELYRGLCLMRTIQGVRFFAFLMPPVTKLPMGVVYYNDVTEKIVVDGMRQIGDVSI